MTAIMWPSSTPWWSRAFCPGMSLIFKGAYVSVIFIVNAVLTCRQNGFAVLDRDLGLLIPVVIQVCILAQELVTRGALKPVAMADGLEIQFATNENGPYSITT